METKQCRNCRRPAQAEDEFCEYCAWELEEMSILRKVGFDLAFISRVLNACHYEAGEKGLLQ